MSPVSHLSLLALASTALATPFAGHGRGVAHERLHSAASASFTHRSDNCTTAASSTGSFKGSFTRTRATTPATSVAPTETSAVPGANTWTNTHYETVYSTISVASSGVSVGAQSSPASDECPAVTVTSTSQYYVTVTGAPSCSEESAGETSSALPFTSIAISNTVTASTAAPYGSPSASASSQGPAAPKYDSPEVSTSEAAPVSSASAPAPAYSAPVTTPAAPAPESSVVESSPAPQPTSTSEAAVAPSVVPSAAYSAPASTSPSASSSPTTGGKRGLAYDDASLNAPFSGSKHVSWAYNWLSSSRGLAENYKFIPTLHSGEDVFTSVWKSDAESAIGSGSTHLFSFNEPDIPSQANMAPAAAASDYAKYMNPLSDKAQLCAPAVSNSDLDGQGLQWFDSFMDACKSQNCHIDCYNFHYYNPSSDPSLFMSHLDDVTAAVQKYQPGAPIFITEFAVDGSDDEVTSFLQNVMPKMDSNDQIAGYSYFMVKDGKLVNGDALSPYGTTYNTYSS